VRSLRLCRRALMPPRSSPGVHECTQSTDPFEAWNRLKLNDRRARGSDDRDS